MPLEPETARLLDLIGSSSAPSLSAGTPEQARAGFRSMTVGLRDPATLAPVSSSHDVVLPGPAGDLPARIYRPEATGPVPTVVFFHGGGFVIGDLDTHDDHCRLLCAQVGAVVLSVDYRLAPEHPFPAAYDDCRAATRWAADHVDELGGDPDRLCVAGDSAGGNLAAAVALAAREDGPPLAAQLLLYPAVDFRDTEHASRVENASGMLLTADDVRWFGDAYVPDPARRDDPRASVLAHEDLTGLPPAVVATAEYDPLRDEGEAYAAALDKAGVQVVARRYEGLVHGFFGLGPVSPGSRAASLELCALLTGLLTD